MFIGCSSWTSPAYWSASSATAMCCGAWHRRSCKGEEELIMPVVARSLDPIFRPESVAVFGASATPGSVGSILMRNLLENPFGGVVYPINPKRRAVHGVHCHSSLSDVPEPVDLA